MQEIPSYVVSGFDDDTLSLMRELDALGGGDAKIFNAEAHAVVVGSDDDDIDINNSTNQTIWINNNRVGFRNTSLSKTEPIANSIKYFTFSSVTKINDIVDSPDTYKFISELKDHIINGFNGTVIAVGEKGAGKTRVLFGPSPPSMTSDIARLHDLPTSFVSSLLHQLYKHKDTSNEAVTIALSVWVIRGSQIVDLLSPSSSSSSSSEGSMEFAVIECADIKTAMQVVSSARDKMPGVLCHPREPLQDCNKEPLHFFLRVILHTAPYVHSTMISSSAIKSNPNPSIKGNNITSNARARTSTSASTNKSDVGRLSILTIVDLVGKLTDSDIAAPVSDDIRVLRRRTNLGLVALARVMSLIKKAHKTKSSGNDSNPLFPCARTSITLTPARDSTLTSILTPMLVGNSKLFMMPFVRDGVRHSIGTHDTLALAHGMDGVLSATFRHSGVSLRGLRMKPPSHCLGPFVVNPFNYNANITTNNSNNDKTVMSTKRTNTDTNVDNNDYASLLEQVQQVSVINKTIMNEIKKINTSSSNDDINRKTNLDDDDYENITLSTISNLNTTLNTTLNATRAKNISTRNNTGTKSTIIDISSTVNYLSKYSNRQKSR